MFGPVASKYFLTAGAGHASTPLNAFDAALIRAGIGDTNLIRMSSILPPGCVEIRPYELVKGSWVPVAYGELISAEPGKLISAAVAVGIPEDPSAAGLIMEHTLMGEPDACEEKARLMVREGMEIIRGIRIKEVKSIATSLMVERVGAVFAAVVLCP